MLINSSAPSFPTRVQSHSRSPQGPVGPGDRFTFSSPSEGPHYVRGAVKLAVGTAIGYGLGSAASAGGFAGAVVGGLTGLITGAIIVGPAGNGKGADGLLYPVGGAVAGLVGGAVLGALGGNPATLMGTALGLGAGLTLAR